MGFGRCAYSRDAVRRVVREASPVTAMKAGHFLADASVCPGDSGGPVLNNRGELVASVGEGDGRGRTHWAPSVFTRLDVWPQLFAAAHELSLGASLSELPPFGECRLPRRSPH